MGYRSMGGGVAGRPCSCTVGRILLLSARLRATVENDPVERVTHPL